MLDLDDDCFKEFLNLSGLKSFRTDFSGSASRNKLSVNIFSI